MTALADPPTTAAPPRVRRPRMRRPAYEPEPIPATAGPGNGPGLVPPPVRTTAGAAPLTSGTGGPGGGPAQACPAADRQRLSPRSAHPDDDLRRRAAATVRAMVEVLAGRRAPAHLAALARPEVVRYLTASRTPGAAAPVAPTRVHVSRPGRDAAEVVAVCRFGTRFRALAVRLDREPTDRGRAWCATAVRLL